MSAETPKEVIPAKEAREQPKTPRTHAVTLENRRRANVTGVNDVVRFDEQEVVLSTSGGEITLLGDGLHIARLHLEEGQLIVEGDITGIEYGQPQAQVARGGFFSRMFR